MGEGESARHRGRQMGQGAGVRQAETGLPVFEGTWVVAAPAHTGGHLGEYVVAVLGVDHVGRRGLQGEAGPGQPLGDLPEDRTDQLLLQIDQHRLGGQEVRPGAAAPHLVHPVRVGDRDGEHATAVRVLEEAPPQRDHIGQVEVEPVDRAVVEPLEAGVEARADLHDRARRVPLQELPYPQVEEQCAQVRPEQALRAVEAGEVVVQGVDHLHGPRIPEHAARFARLNRTGVEGDEQRLLDVAELGRALVHDRLLPSRGVLWSTAKYYGVPTCPAASTSSPPRRAVRSPERNRRS